jgi:hypothetical protein
MAFLLHFKIYGVKPLPVKNIHFIFSNVFFGIILSVNLSKWFILFCIDCIFKFFSNTGSNEKNSAGIQTPATKEQRALQPVLLDHFAFSSCLIFYIMCRTPWTGDQPVARPHKHNKRTQTSVLWVEFEPTMLVFVRTKSVDASDRAATVIGDVVGTWSAIIDSDVVTETNYTYPYCS